jgi:uncharacterized protein (TIGR03435 family)
MQSLRTISTILIVAVAAIAQDQKPPEFEVASIKPAAPDARGMWIRTAPGGRVNITNMTLKELIVIAWRVQPFQISGGPAWLDSVHYDISAKPESSPKQGEIPLMLQALLTDRFQLTIHRETKELPVYALVLAKRDGKLGPGLTESKEGACTQFDPTKPSAPPEPGKPPVTYCGNMRMSPSSMQAIRVPMAQMIPMLERRLGRTVIDKTGLTGNFDFSVEWTPDETLGPRFGPDAPQPQSDTAGPSIFTALQEQLGLKLESQKGPVEILVIDRAEKPTEN